MATLKEFMRTGHLGPVILGMSANDVVIALGEPEGTSRKSSPLVLKYGCVQLSFWRGPNQGVPQFREIVIAYQPVFEPAPASLAFTDWVLTSPPTEQEFKLLVQQIDYPPTHLVEGPSGKQLLFPSGVAALFTDGMLHSVRLVQREHRSVPPGVLADEREPSVEQIREMLSEAEQVSEVGAHRAALLIAWAGLEAALRRTALRTGVPGKIGMQPSLLFRELFAAGALTPEEHEMLEELRQIRTASAHGLAPGGLSPDYISKIKGATNRLLAAAK